MSSRKIMQSTSVADPLSVSNSVSKMREPSRYWRRMARTGSAGEIDQCPFSAVPSRAAKQAGESKCGRQSQSIEPCFETKAAVWQSPIIA